MPVEARLPVPRAQIQRALEPFLAPSLFWGMALVVADLLQYAAAIAGVLFLPSLGLKALAAVFAGLKIANLVTLGHDAAHETLTPNRTLNRVLGTLVFAPGLTNWALWIHEHHYRHHPHTNGDFIDTYTPLSKAEYDALPAWRRFLKRLHRNPLGLGFAVYYITERWWYVKLFPRSGVGPRFRSWAWRHFAFLMVYLACFLGFLAAAPYYSDTGSITAIALGFVVPFVMFMELMGISLYFQHTHISIPWFKGEVDRRLVPQERVTLHVDFPGWFSRYMHNVYEHPVHHVQPAIPCYRLRPAEATLNRLSPDHVVSEKFSFRLL